MRCLYDFLFRPLAAGCLLLLPCCCLFTPPCRPAEEGFLAESRKRSDELAADLAEVRTELAAFLERRSELDRACHDVLTAQERDRDQQLTEAHVDHRIRWERFEMGRGKGTGGSSAGGMRR